MKKYLLIIGFLILIAGLIGGGVYYWKKENNQPQSISYDITLTTQQEVTTSTSTSINIYKNDQLVRLIPDQLNATTSIFTVTEKGGIVFSTDGQMQAEIPDGAVMSTIKVTIGTINNDHGQYNWGQFGPLYKITPINGVDLVSFLKPAVIKIHYNPQILPIGAIETESKVLILGAYDSWELFATTTIDTVNNILTSTISYIKNDGDWGTIGIIPAYIRF
ncbi:MAG: hypothetical protein AAB757_02340 [Patescibacteria group bacterium]